MSELGGMDELTDETRSEIDALRLEYRDTETRIQALTIGEDTPTPVETRDDGEGREIQELRERVTLSSYINAARELRSVDGAEREFNQHLGMSSDMFPLEMLAPPLETRATTDVDAAVMQQTWVDRLFADTAAARLGITMPSVAPGVAAYPVTTAGATAGQKARGAAAGDAPWTVGVEEIKPTRNPVRAVFSMEDAARLPSLEQALRRDLAAALTEGIDRAIFTGDTAGGNATAAITGLNTAAISEVEVTQANKVKGPETLTGFLGMVDGVHAGGLGELNVILSVGAYRLWEGTITNAAADNMTVAAFLRQAGLSWMVRGEIETATAAGDFGAFVGRGRGIEGAGVAPMWESAQLVRDPYTRAAEGEIALTLTTLWGFDLPRPSNFARLKFVA